MGGGLLGVADDGTIVGTTRDNLEDWVAELCRVKIDPPVVPLMTRIRDVQPCRDILAIQIPEGLDKPYARVHNNSKTYYIRIGPSSREASREELVRMFQASGLYRYGVKPVPGAGLDALDRRRIYDYFVRVLGGTVPDQSDSVCWKTLLQNTDLMTISAGMVTATVDGMLLFGRETRRYVPQSGIRALCFPGTKPDYQTRADEVLPGPIAPLGVNEIIGESGLVEQAWNFVRRNTTPTSHLQNGRRIDGWEYPESVVREAIVNAITHRDYTIAGTDIMLAVFANRLEITSPGALPNTMTVEKMKAGARYARNQNLVNVMRDYGYANARSMGVREKMIPGMKEHNGTEPDFIEEKDRLTIRLWKHAGRS